MKLDKIKFARLIAMIASEYKYVHDDFVQSLDDLIDIPEPSSVVYQPIKPSDIDDLLEAMFGDDKIKAIKQYRHLTGLQLREAKEAVEKYRAGLNSGAEKFKNRMLLFLNEQRASPDEDVYLLKGFNNDQLNAVERFIHSFF